MNVEMMPFYHVEEHPSDRVALIDDRGVCLTYSELAQRVAAFANGLTPRSLMFIFCRNQIEVVIAYLACLQKKTVALLLDDGLDDARVQQLIDIYRPAWLWRAQHEGYQLQETGLAGWPVHDDLALLMTTSGSTGSPKLVRLSYQNLQSNAASIGSYLALDESERGLVSLPLNYVYGLSIVNSHLHAGATLLLTAYSVMQREFWTFVREKHATSLPGVPYTWEMLKKLRFMRMDLPHLHTLTQAGGKLSSALQLEFAEYARQNGKRFIVMYGAAEATSRMGWLAPEFAAELPGSIGKAIPGGEFILLDEQALPVKEAGCVGELVYRGPNVALGYALCGDDLARDDDFNGVLYTGDLAVFDNNGFYSITGRKKRFLKVFGNRVGLDEIESLIKQAFPGIDCACDGRDDLICLFLTDASQTGAVKQYICDVSRLHHSAVQIIELETIPRNESGKTLYHRLKDYVPHT